jgi:hypothetical protein
MKNNYPLSTLNGAGAHFFTESLANSILAPPAG